MKPMKPTAVYPEMKGKVFVVTGAASGMGRTLALQLAAQGANLGLLDLNKPDGTAREITEIANAGDTLSLACNVQDSSAVDAAHRAVIDKWGRLDGAANLAGYGGNQKLGETGYALQNLKDSDWDFMLTTNLGGVKNCLRAQFQVMKGPGSIVNAASVAGQKGHPNAGPYNTSKWGVIGLTKCAAQESALRGITVNAVAP
jgi:3-oxoacyl-[acyl-carrier protein] reductase